jgi:hypothetical protein
MYFAMGDNPLLRFKKPIRKPDKKAVTEPELK